MPEKRGIKADRQKKRKRARGIVSINPVLLFQALYAIARAMLMFYLWERFRLHMYPLHNS